MHNMYFGTFVNIAVLKNNDTYTFALFSAILNLRKLNNHPMERCASVNKCAFENIKKCH